MRRLMEQFKIDTIIVPQALNNTNSISSYCSMDNYAEAQINLSLGAMAATKTAKIEVYQAKDEDGTGAEIVADADGNAYKAEVTANTGVREVKIALASVGAADKVTINGVTYTKDTTTDASAKKFKDAAGLVLCIAYHQPELSASASGTDVNVKYADEGAGTITASAVNVGGTVTISTVSATALFSMLREYMKSNDGFTHIAVKVTTTANTIVCVQMLRGNEPRYSAIQEVGALTMVR